MHGSNKLEEFHSHLKSSLRESIQFTIENEQNDCHPFLDVMVVTKRKGNTWSLPSTERKCTQIRSSTINRIIILESRVVLSHTYGQEWRQFYRDRHNQEEITPLWCFCGQGLPSGDGQEVLHKHKHKRSNWREEEGMIPHGVIPHERSCKGSQSQSNFHNKSHFEMLLDEGQNFYWFQQHQRSLI